MHVYSAIYINSINKILNYILIIYSDAPPPPPLLNSHARAYAASPADHVEAASYRSRACNIDRRSKIALSWKKKFLYLKNGLRLQTLGGVGSSSSTSALA